VKQQESAVKRDSLPAHENDQRASIYLDDNNREIENSRADEGSVSDLNISSHISHLG